MKPLLGSSRLRQLNGALPHKGAPPYGYRSRPSTINWRIAQPERHPAGADPAASANWFAKRRAGRTLADDAFFYFPRDLQILRRRLLSLSIRAGWRCWIPIRSP
ncbi:hypothetical protein MJ585_09435 [Klebsiella pneumoniae]|nr:hypothetical protein MJ585_09435 [Klebsiella pneumoniae]